MNENEPRQTPTQEQADLDEFNTLIEWGASSEDAHKMIVQRRLAETARIAQYNDLVAAGRTPEEAMRVIYERAPEPDQDRESSMDTFHDLIRQGMSIEEASAKANGYTWSESNREEEAKPTEALDASRLNEIIREAYKLGTCIGREILITDHDRDQFRLIASRINTLTEPLKASLDWQHFMDLVDEGGSKGILLSFAAHEGTNVDKWCIDGGPDAKVKKVLRTDAQGNKAAGIQVPTNLFELYNVDSSVRSLLEFTRSDATLKGASARPLGMTLKILGRYMKKTQTA